MIALIVRAIRTCVATAELRPTLPYSDCEIVDQVITCRFWFALRGVECVLRLVGGGWGGRGLPLLKVVYTRSDPHEHEAK